MPAVTLAEAIKMLKDAMRRYDLANLREIYEELFPDAAVSEEQLADSAFLIQQILAYLDGQEIAEILDRWRVFLPEHGNPWYDGEIDRIEYEELPERTYID